MLFQLHSVAFHLHSILYLHSIPLCVQLSAFHFRSLVLLIAICHLRLSIAVAAPMSSDDSHASPASIAFFEESIRPLLENRCYKCHSAQATELHANLYLDSRPGWQKGGDSGPAIVSGNPRESLVMQVIGYSKDAATRMPPDGKLPDKEIDLLSKWIEMGAPDPRREALKHIKQRTIDLESERNHWAYLPLAKVESPSDAQLAGSDPRWLSSPIDRFLMVRLKERSIAPNGPTDKAKLMRRVYFDLIGLPPTPAEVDTFLSDSDPRAFEGLIDRLLASQHYGENDWHDHAWANGRLCSLSWPKWYLG